MTKFYRVPHGSWADERDGKDKIAGAVADGWLAVDMFERDFERHQAYLVKFREIYDWAREHAGTGAEDWYCVNNTWLFRDRSIGLLFKLTWKGT